MHFFIFRDEYLAYKAALFFCINPASVLYLAPLTLTLLSAATFAAMASVEDGMGLFTGIYLAMATAAQPSGILNLLMVLYSSMRQVATQTILYVKHKKKTKQPRQADRGSEVEIGEDFSYKIDLCLRPGFKYCTHVRFTCGLYLFYFF